LPDHRHKPGDEHAGGRKPGGKKPRPDGTRGEGPGFDGPRFEGPRADGPRFEGPKSFGPRPSYGAPRPGGFGGPRPGGPRPSYGAPRPGGFGGARPSGPRPGGFGGPRPGGPRPSYGAPRPGGFGGPPPGAPEGRPVDRPNEGRPNFPDREWQPNESWTPRPQRPFGHSGPRPSGPRPGGYSGPRPGGFSGPRPGGPRPSYGGPRPGGFSGPRPGGPRPGYDGPRPGYDGPRPGYDGPRPGYDGPRPGYDGPRPGYDGPRPGGFSGRRSADEGPRPAFDEGRPQRGGFGFGEHRPEPAPRRAPVDRDLEELPPDATAPDEFAAESFAAEASAPDTGEPEATADSSGSSTSAAPGEFSGPTVRQPGPPRRPDYRARSGGYPDRRPFRPGAAPAAAWSRPPASPPSPDLLGEDEEIIAGRHPVEEAFIAHRKAIRLLVVPQRRQALEKLVLHATNLRIPIVEVEGGTLTSLAGFDGHQGIALVTDRRQFAGIDDLLARAIERKEAPFVIVLDSLEDPQNFGSLLRTAEACGVHGVVYPTHRQAPLSAAAIKASAGAVEHLLLVPVEDLAEALTDLHVRGLRIVGSDADAPLTARQADLRGPVAIVVGSEGQGLGPAVRRRCDAVVRIPMRGHLSSLNASVAGSILLYEASSQRIGDLPIVTPAALEAAPTETAPDVAAEIPTEPATGAAAELAPPPVSAKATPRRRAASRKVAAELPVHADDELLPGGPAIDPAGSASDSATPSVDPVRPEASSPDAESGQA